MAATIWRRMPQINTTRAPGLPVGAMVALLLAVVLTLPAPARASSRAACVASWRDTVSPGITLTPAVGAFTSHGETGTITCVGSVKGHRVTRPGTFGEQGVVRGNCAFGSGSALFSMTIPTSAGAARLQIPAVFTYAGGVGLRPTGIFPGGFVFYPVRGDCITSPVTEIAVVLHGTLTT